jgi:HD-GYP domain-containing protein (c-di-GMP phosphodiesterase class II)
MKKVLVEDLKPGVRSTKPVFIDSNNMLVGADVPIKESDIKRLMKWGIKEIETDGDLYGINVEQVKEVTSQSEINKILNDYNTLMQLREDLNRVYDLSCKAVAKAHTAIRNKRMFSMTDLEHSIDDILYLLRKNRNVFLFLYGLEKDKDPLVIHAVNVTFYALLIGVSLKYSPIKLRALGLGTLLINAGMIQLPAYILHKESDLTDHEQNLIKTHPLLGYQAVKNYGNIGEQSALISLQHHEQYDGQGYPRNLKGIEINEFARIVSIADNYEALIESRSYRNKQFFYQAMKQLMSTGARKFDPVLLRLFVSVLSVYPIGSIVELNKRGIGVVIGSKLRQPLRPFVKLIFDEQRNLKTNLEIVNLLEDQSLYISRTLDEDEAGISIADVL